MREMFRRHNYFVLKCIIELFVINRDELIITQTHGLYDSITAHMNSIPCYIIPQPAQIKIFFLSQNETSL
jgi:hypothetical protein